jgi:hypothetical protein
LIVTGFQIALIISSFAGDINCHFASASREISIAAVLQPVGNEIRISQKQPGKFG